MSIKERADARLRLREILSVYLGQAPERIQFEITATGKPTHPEIFFSLSHTHDLALIAISKELPVGVDIEKIRPVSARRLIAKRFFSPAEQESLERLAPELQERRFFELWTAKEALTKLKGGRLLEELGKPVCWEQVMPVPGLEGYVAHLACMIGCHPSFAIHSQAGHAILRLDT